MARVHSSQRSIALELNLIFLIQGVSLSAADGSLMSPNAHSLFQS